MSRPKARYRARAEYNTKLASSAIVGVNLMTRRLSSESPRKRRIGVWVRRGGASSSVMCAQCLTRNNHTKKKNNQDKDHRAEENGSGDSKSSAAEQMPPAEAETACDFQLLPSAVAAASSPLRLTRSGNCNDRIGEQPHTKAFPAGLPRNPSSVEVEDVTVDNSHEENDMSNSGHSISAPEGQGFGEQSQTTVIPAKVPTSSSLVEGAASIDNSHGENNEGAIERSISWLKDQTLCIVQSRSDEWPRDHSLVEGDVDARNDKDDKQDKGDVCVARRLQKDPSVLSADLRLPRDPSLQESNTGVDPAMLGSDASVVDSRKKGQEHRCQQGRCQGIHLCCP